MLRKAEGDEIIGLVVGFWQYIKNILGKGGYVRGEKSRFPNYVLGLSRDVMFHYFIQYICTRSTYINMKFEFTFDTNYY